MTFLSLFEWINDVFLAIPATILFLTAGIVFTLYTRFAQIRYVGRCIRLIKEGFAAKSTHKQSASTINRFHALFTAMATTIGTGNVVGPAVAVYTGGPGALFWLVVYIFFASATKFVEVTLAVATRIKTEDGRIIGGPMQYLRLVHPWLAYWYIGVMTVLFVGFSTIQSNALAEIFAQENVPHWCTGLALSCIVLLVLYGGIKRIGLVASRLVPFMFVLYVVFASLILFHDMQALQRALYLVMTHAFYPAAMTGGFLGATLLQAMRSGTYKGVFISEAGLGTSSIAHALADVKNPQDQGILAMFSMAADALLSMLSGLLVLVTGVWLKGCFRSTFIYEAFKLNAPVFGQWALLIAITLFVVTTVIGNSFNGIQSYASIAHYRGVKTYTALVLLAIFVGALIQPRLAWAIMETLMTCVAIPHLIGLLILVFTRKDLFRKQI